MSLVDGLRKALLPKLPEGAQEVAVNPAEIALATGVRDVIDSVTGQTWMGPNQPMRPIAPTSTLPRAFDYPFGSNLYFTPRQEQPSTPDFAQLRQLARYDIVRLCIETRKAQILEMPWQFRVKRKPGENKKSYKNRNDSDERIEELTKFFQSPDHENDFFCWINMIVEEVLVTDATAIWPVMSKDNRPLSLRLIDGATIKPLHDSQGWRPNAPNPAFQQIIKGSPAINMTAGLCPDCKLRGFHKEPNGEKGNCLPLIYMPFNPTVDRFYGWSPTEQVLHTILIGMNRLISQLALYTEGNLPEALISLPESWGDQQIRQFQAWFDQLAGDVAIKRRVRFIPEVKQFIQTKDPMIKDDRDDWLARVCCYAFSVAPNALVKQMNRASAQQIAASAIEEGKLPLLGRLSDLINNAILGYWGPEYADLEHSYNTDEVSDPHIQAQIYDIKIKNASMAINEAREDDGMDPVDGGDKPMIFLPSGPVLLEDAAAGNLPGPVPPGQFPAPGAGSGKPVAGPATPAPPFGGKQPPPGKKGQQPPVRELTPVQQAEAKKLLKLFPLHSVFGKNGNGHKPNRIVY